MHEYCIMEKNVAQMRTSFKKIARTYDNADYGEKANGRPSSAPRELDH